MGNCLAFSSKIDSAQTVHTGQDSRGGSEDFHNPSPEHESETLSSLPLKSFTYNELKNACGNSLISQSGFGSVYKAWVDEQTLVPTKPGSGMPVSVKVFNRDSSHSRKEWLNEVSHLGQLHHPNIVKLIGYSLEGDNALSVYEFMSEGSLDSHLFGREAEPLSWAIRIKVAIDAARGLSFLHKAEPQIVYRDFKPSNILLDADFNAKLFDFSLAKAVPIGDSRTYMSTQVMGTYGYADPAYVATGQLSTKSDVYSLGVVLLELLSGRRAIDLSKKGTEQNIVDWAKPYLGSKRNLIRIMDAKFEGQYPKNEAGIVATLASKCLCNDPKLRPPMSDVLSTLEKIQSN